MTILLLLHGHNLFKELFCRAFQSNKDSVADFLKRHGGHCAVICMCIQNFRIEVKQGVITHGRGRKAIYVAIKTLLTWILLSVSSLYWYALNRT